MANGFAMGADFESAEVCCRYGLPLLPSVAVIGGEVRAVAKQVGWGAVVANGFANAPTFESAGVCFAPRWLPRLSAQFALGDFRPAVVRRAFGDAFAR
jgi:hypothetical protein